MSAAIENRLSDLAADLRDMSAPPDKVRLRSRTPEPGEAEPTGVVASLFGKKSLLPDAS